MRTALLVAAAASVAQALTITNSSAGIAGGTYDFVVVGSGPGGLTVASRLAQRSPKTRILVIEAGDDQRGNPIVEDPANAGSAFLSPGLAKLFFSTPQHASGRQLFILWGQTLGGGSTINGMQWDRAQIAQYDALEQLGNPGWNWASLSSYMRKSEAFKVPTPQQAAAGFTYDASAHGYTGRVSAGMPRPLNGTALQFEYQDTVHNATLGGSSLPTHIDFCTGNPNGAGLFQYAIFPATSDTSLNNKRCNAAEAYVYPFLSTYANLTILTGHLATRMQFGNANGTMPRTATAVEFIPTAGGATSFVNVTKEVVVAGGAYASPAFLELSGVGDPNILGPLGIPLVVNLTSVGRGLQDQFFVNFEWDPAPGAPFIPPQPNLLQFVSTSFLTLKQVVGNATAASMGAALSASVNSRAAATVASGGFSSVLGLRKILKLQADLIVNQSTPVEEFLGGPASFGQIPSTNTWSVTPTLLNPSSRGWTHINSSDPLVTPIVNPNLFTDPFDIKLQVESVKFARRLAATAPMSTRVGAETIPGFAVLPANATDTQIANWIRETYLTAAHPMGSLSMLPRIDGGAVSEKLRVYGLRNVRVADASIIPIQLATHPQGTIYGIGEKAADIIIAENGL